MAPEVQKEFAQAWLVSKDGRNSYQLFIKETRIGRSMKNDIVLEGDRSVSRESARVLEQNGHFRLQSLSAARYPRIGGQTVREPILLEHDDEIEFGENTVLQFIKSDQRI
jgi:predicted component of type VI protein secretion system